MEALEPSGWGVHDLLAQALTGTGDRDGAVAEYKEALQIWPNNAPVTSRLAELMEENGDFVGALEQYRKAAGLQGDHEFKAQYAAAQQRTNAHI